MNLRTSLSRVRWTLPVALALPLLLLSVVWLTGQALSPATTYAQDVSGITSPVDGETVSGVVTILGTAADDTFQRYELYYKPSEALAVDYIYLDDRTSAVVDGELGVWDTTELAPGSYDLRLRVVRADGNYTEYFVEGLQVEAPAQTPPDQATAVVTATVEATATSEVTPTVEVTATAEAVPTATAVVTETPTVTDTPTITSALPVDAAQLVVGSNINVRSGPGTNYPVVTALQAGQTVLIIGRNQAGDWWQIQVANTPGWVLASLGSAANTDDVPVVNAPPVPSATTPTTGTVTPTTPTTATLPVTTTEAVTDTVAGASVTVTGSVDDIEILTLFVRTLLVGFGLDNAAVTATVGALPGDFPIDITVPTTATIVGGVIRDGEFGGSQLYLSTAESVEGLAATLSEQMFDDGFVTPPAGSVGGSSEVFLSSTLNAPLTFCSADSELLVNLNALTLADGIGIVSISVNTATGFGGPCSETGEGEAVNVFAALPVLTPPDQAQVFGRGSGSSTGSEGYSITAQADIETDQPIATLATHYDGQLEEAGWVRIGDSATEDVSWSAWTFSSDDAEWTATFYIVRQVGNAGRYLATLYAETTQ